MTTKRYKHFLLNTEPSPELDELLESLAKTVSRHMDDDQQPYYHLQTRRLVTVKRLKKITGCDNIMGVTTSPSWPVLVEMARSSVREAKKEREALITRGKVLAQVLNEDNTDENILSIADRRALKLYKKSLK